LSFPLVGNLSCTGLKKDAGQAGMTDWVNALLGCRVNTVGKVKVKKDFPATPPSTLKLFCYYDLQAC